MQSLCLDQQCCSWSTKHSILFWVVHHRSTGSSFLHFRDFSLVRCSLVLWECSPGPLAKSSAGEVLRSHGCRSAMAPLRQAFSSRSFGARFIFGFCRFVTACVLPTCWSRNTSRL